MADHRAHRYVRVRLTCGSSTKTQNLASHAALGDDEYNGYHIPAGSMIMINVWRILHNPEKYPEPDTFNPDRYLKQSGEVSGSDKRAMNPELVNEDPWHYIFGFGLRYVQRRVY